MTAYSRADRVGGLIQRTLSDILLRSVKDPRIQHATITHVKVTRDLRIARIYFSVSGGDHSVALGTVSAALMQAPPVSVHTSFRLS